jgi:hypothetical protein
MRASVGGYFTEQIQRPGRPWAPAFRSALRVNAGTPQYPVLIAALPSWIPTTANPGRGTAANQQDAPSGEEGE